MRLNRSPFKPRVKGDYRIENKAVEEATVYIYDEIGWFGVTADKFIKDLNEIKSAVIHVRLNSPGGAVFDGIAIYNALKQHKSKIIVHVDGLAASAASIIAMAGNEMHMGEGAFFMIHDPWSIVIGMAEDMRKEAELLDKVSGQIANIYTSKTKKSAEEIHEYMAAETWFTAQEAKDSGFADAIEEDEKSEKNQAHNLYDLSVFANVPEALRDKKKTPTVTDLERVLRDAGCSTKQAKTILSKGFSDASRDVEQPENTVIEPLAEKLPRDVEVAVKPVIKDRVSDLLTRAEVFAPSTM